MCSKSQTLPIVSMDRTPIQAPNWSSCIKDMCGASRYEIRCKEQSRKVQQEASWDHRPIFKVWNICISARVWEPKGPKEHATGGGGLKFPSSVVTSWL